MKKISSFLMRINRIFYVLIDFGIVFGLTFVAHLYNFNELSTTSHQQNNIIIFSAILAATMVLSFIILKVYKILTTEFSLIDEIKISIIAISVSIIGFVVEIIINHIASSKYFAPQWYIFLPSVFSIVFFLIAFRLGIKYFYKLLTYSTKNKKINTLIVGAGHVANMVASEIINNPKMTNKIVGFIDDDPKKINKLFRNIKIYGPISNIKDVVNKLKVETVIFAISTLEDSKFKEVLNNLKETTVRIKRAPLLSELKGPFEAKVMDVDINELLSRPIKHLNNKEITNALKEKVVLITGAGGSIGGELSNQVFETHPKKLVLFDIYENGVYDIQMGLLQKMRKEKIDDIDLVVKIGSTYDYKRMEQIISEYKPDYIFHAAAYKHVPLMEDSPQEALRTNVIGTYNVAKLADEYKVKKMILVSTDKAVRPTNIMGASKRIAEEIIKYFAEKSKNTIYCAVRFGNVLNSNGSVIPLFKKQISEMGPVTITDKRILRYFMSIQESVSLILQTILYSKKGEIFVLDMGLPVKILDLAEKMIRQAGYKPYQDIDIVEIGLRPGEKLYEELLVDKNKHKKVSEDLIFVEEYTPSLFKETMLKEFDKIIIEKDKDKVKELTSKIVKSYTWNK